MSKVFQYNVENAVSHIMDSQSPRLDQIPSAAQPVETSADSGADLGLDSGLSGRVSEMVGEDASENSGENARSSSKTSDAAQATQAQTKESLRERLLQSAPALPQMRQEVLQQLERQKTALEAQIREERAKANYHQISILIRDLRSVLNIIERVAHASAEALKDFWLKIVKKFA